MRSWLLICCLAGVLAGCGMPPPAATPAATASQVQVPGTRLLLTPPAGFRVSADYAGLERDDSTGIVVMDLTVGNFYTNAATFSREEFEARGAQVLAYQDTTVSGYPAKAALLAPTPATRGYCVVFGDSSFSAMLTATYRSRDTEVGMRIKEALLTATYDKKIKLHPLATAPFTLDTTRTGFRLAVFSGGMYTYTVGGAKAPATPQHEAAIVVVPLPASPGSTPATLLANAVQQLEANGLTGTSRQHASAAPVNGYDACEEEISGLMKGKKALFYELIISNGRKTVMVQGILPAGSEGELSAVREFAHSLTLR